MDSTSSPRVTATGRDANGRILPGISGNPAGRARSTVSIVKALNERFEKEPGLVNDVIDSWLKLIRKPDANALNMLVERLDGKVASQLAVTGILLHVGNEYATQGLQALELDSSERQHRLGMGTEGVIEGEIVSEGEK